MKGAEILWLTAFMSWVEAASLTLFSSPLSESLLFNLFLLASFLCLPCVLSDLISLPSALEKRSSPKKRKEEEEGKKEMKVAFTCLYPSLYRFLSIVTKDSAYTRHMRILFGSWHVHALSYTLSRIARRKSGTKIRRAPLFLSFLRAFTCWHLLFLLVLPFDGDTKER